MAADSGIFLATAKHNYYRLVRARGLGSTAAVHFFLKDLVLTCGSSGFMRHSRVVGLGQAWESGCPSPPRHHGGCGLRRVPEPAARLRPHGLSGRRNQGYDSVRVASEAPRDFLSPVHRALATPCKTKLPPAK